MEIVSGIITRGVGGLYEVDTENEIIECKAKGVFRHDMIAPTVGDRVTVEVDKDSAVISKIEERKNAKLEKNYALADEIRNRLDEKGIVLLDSKDGTTWGIKELQ